MRRRGATLRTMQPARHAGHLLLVAFVLCAAGCGTRVVKTPIVETEAIEVSLRHQEQGGIPVEHDFAHPASISSQRLSHILGAMDITMQTEERGKLQLAAIHPELLQPVSRAMANAFAKADSSQEVVVIAVRKQDRLAIFHKKYLTTLIAFFRGNRLYIHLSRVEWEIAKDRKNKVLPQPERSEKQMAFRAVPGRKMSQAGSQGVAVRWQDPLFSVPVRTTNEIGGPRRQRTILLDSPAPSAGGEDEPSAVTPDLSPETLRELADLEEARRAGKLTEPEYEQQREALLEGAGR